jgi:hypothetical protein
VPNDVIIDRVEFHGIFAAVDRDGLTPPITNFPDPVAERQNLPGLAELGWSTSPSHMTVSVVRIFSRHRTATDAQLPTACG